MEAILTESVLPPKYVRGTLGKVVVIELHAQDRSPALVRWAESLRDRSPRELSRLRVSRIAAPGCRRRAKLDGHDAGQLLLYVPAVDRPAARLAKSDFDEMRAEPSIRASAKLPAYSQIA